MVNVAEVCDERLNKWRARLINENATPILIVGVGHDHKSGELQLITVEDMPNDRLIAFLRFAIRKLVENG